MKCFAFILLAVLLCNSCAIKRKGGMQCRELEEVSSVLLRQHSLKTSDSTTKLYVQLFSDEVYSDFEAVRYRLLSSTDSLYQGFFNERGFLELELSDGLYSLEFNAIHLPEFKLDSLIILPQFETRLEIKTGRPGGFVTVRKR